MNSMIEFKYDIIRKSGLLDIEQPEHGFEAVGGYDILKRFIMNNVVKVLRNPDKAKRLGLRPPRGILLFGPPGTGKTWFARALAKELQLPFLRLKTEKIVSMWYGETSRNLAKALEISESVAPCVLFIDEVDRFGKRGGPAEHEETRRAFSILLEWLGDARRKTIVVATTNRPEDLDEAFRRVGRFDYIIPMLYPDAKARLEILTIHTSVVRKVPLAKDVDLSYIARVTEYWSGAELEELVLRAARKALEEDSDVVTMKHFSRALETFKVNQAERQEQLRRYLQLAEEFTNDTEFLEQLKKSYEQVSRIEAVKEF
jgi:transitional endoplasmic reticulum ATPase